MIFIQQKCMPPKSYRCHSIPSITSITSIKLANTSSDVYEGHNMQEELQDSVVEFGKKEGKRYV
jgi:hypothetical protein